MNTALLKRDPHLEAIEAEFETAFKELCDRYEQKKLDAEKLLEPAEVILDTPAVVPPAVTIPKERLQAAAEHIADAVRSIKKGDLRGAEESFNVAMALGLPGSTIMNVAEKALATLKPKRTAKAIANESNRVAGQ